jgi:hypothetical protein
MLQNDFKDLMRQIETKLQEVHASAPQNIGVESKPVKKPEPDLPPFVKGSFEKKKNKKKEH